MHRSFTDIQFYQIQKRTDLYWYMGYAWLTPLAVIIPCVACDLIDSTLLQYGSVNTCWITVTHEYVLLYVFVGPVVALVIINIIFFARSAFALYVTFRLVNDAFHNKNRIFRSYCGLFMFSGITWLLGLLPNIANSLLLWYPFVIVNILQGFFIFMVFGLPHLKCRISKDPPKRVGTVRMTVPSETGPRTSPADRECAKKF